MVDIDGINASFKFTFNDSLTGLESIVKEVDKLTSNLTNLNKIDSTKSLDDLDNTLQLIISSIKKVNVESDKLKDFSVISRSVNSLANGLKLLATGSINSEEVIRNLDSFLKRLSVSSIKLSTDLVKVETSESRVRSETANLESQFARVSSDFTEVSSKTTQLDSKLDGLENGLRKTSQASNSTSQGIDKLGNESNTASNEVQNISNKVNNLDKNLGKVNKTLGYFGQAFRNVFSNYVQKAISGIEQSITETYKAKSEMQSWFDVMGMSSSQVDSFNSKLDETVSQFQRVNKYGMGETIASLGVEFKLSEAEMEKAMSTTAMVTNEYLRAGRNASEANLAIKDILQGQFQRLSRETGVGEQDLIDAGWSGDNTDVMGILTALEKIAKDRNWDEIAQKASSINDIMLIGQNRISEWASELADRFTPLFVGVFNTAMDLFNTLQPMIDGALDWLGGGSLEAIITNWGLLSSAIGLGSNALIQYRTGAGLVQMAQMGLKDSIVSTILGLDAEKVALHGSRTAIISKITALNMEKASNLSLKQAILSKVMGLNAETVAEHGLKGAIIESIAVKKGESVEEALNTFEKQKNTIALTEQTLQNEINSQKRMMSTGAISEETAMERISTAQKELNALMSEKQALANVGLTETLYYLGTQELIVAGETDALSIAMGVLNGVFMLSPIGWITAGILALAGAFYVLSGGLSDTWGKMKEFNDIMQNAGEEQKKANQWLEQVKKDAGETSDEFIKASESVDTFTQNLQSASYWYNHSKTAFEGMDLSMSTSSGDILKKYGLDDKQVSEFNNRLTTLKLGKDKYYKAEQVLNKQIKGENSNFGRDLDEYLGHIKDAGGDIEEASERMAGNYQNLAEHSYIANTTDDWWEWMWNSLYAGMDQFWIDWDKFWANPKWGDALDGITKFANDINPLTQLMKHFGADFSGSWEELFKNIGKFFEGKSLMELIGLDPNKDYIGDFFNWIGDSLANIDILSDLTNALTNIDVFGSIWDTISGWFTGGSDFNGMKKIDTTWISNIAFGIIDAIKNFDWMGALGGLADTFGISNLVSAIFGATEGMDITWAWDWVNSNIISPISTTIQTFLADPIAFIGNVGFGLMGLMDGLFGTDVFTQVWTWVNTSIITPFGTAIYNGIMSIPILGDVLQMLGFTDQAQGTSSSKGQMLARAFGNAVTTVIGQIPIVSDILRMLGLIPQTEPNASSHGRGVGKSAVDGVKNGLSNLGSLVIQEFTDALNGIGRLGQQAFNVAKGWADQLWQGVNSILQRASPGFFHDQFMLEFGTDIPNAITSSGATAYSVAQGYAQNIKQGIADSGTTTIGMDGMVSEYESDAQIIASSSQMMGMTTTTAFNDMQLSVNNSTGQMANNVNTQYTSMQQKQATLLTNMKTSNTNAYNDLYQKTNTSLLQMRSSTENVTHQMTNAWKLMKNNIVDSAQKLKHDSTVHFNTLSNTIGSFYRKIQNPSSWGSAGSPSYSSGRRNPRMGRAFTSSIKHGGYAGGTGGNRWGNRDVMTIASLKNKLCPSGDCGDLFDGFKNSDVVNVSDFLALMIPEGHGFGGWSYNNTHYAYIKNKSDQWGMKSPTINLKGGIPTDADYKVADFENGSPKISFSSFQSMSESIFSAIPYRFYYDSDWKGSWLGALQAGACNCWDGAHALLAFAQSCGFSGGIQHGTWVDPDGTSYPHVFAVINGKKMDTTGWQQRRSWSAGSPNIGGGKSTTNKTKTVNVTVNINGTVYGVDDLDNKIQEGVKKGLQEEFNDPFTVVI